MSFQPQEWGHPALTGDLLESETEPCELSAEFVFAVPVSSTPGFLSLPLCWVFFMFSFHHWSFADLDFFCACLPPHGGWVEVFFSQVKSESWHHRCKGSVSFPLFCITAAKIWNDRRTSVTAQFYLASKEKYILEAWGWPNRNKKNEEKLQLNFCSSFYIYIYIFFFSSSRWACRM